MKLIDYFNNNEKGNVIHKWIHYFDIYEKHFSPFLGKKIKILEIGVWQGGSLKMWKEYFGKDAQIIGVDRDPQCKKFEEEQIRIYAGDQADVQFLQTLIKSEAPFDIIIDDGGHNMHQQITSFKELYRSLNNGGIYLCEDTHTSYMRDYSGGYKKSDTFIEYTKTLIDRLMGFWIDLPEFKNDEFTRNTNAIHIYDSIVIFEKQYRKDPEAKQIGIKTLK